MSRTNTVQLLAVGDVYFNRESLEQPYEALQPLLDSADLRFCNYEAAISSVEHARPERPYPLRTPLRNLDAVMAGKFDVVALAHNHLLDFGLEALEETLSVLTQAGQVFVGAGRTLAEALQPAIVEHDGIRLGFLSFACAFPPSYAASPSSPGIAPLRIEVSEDPGNDWEAEHPGIRPGVDTWANKADLATMKTAVAALKEQVDHVIVSYHWGVLGHRATVAYQREIAHASVDAGASLVLGHHAHVLQGVERHGSGLIFYGLSHVIFDMPGIVNDFDFDHETAAAEVIFSKDKIQSAGLHPLWMADCGGPRRVNPAEAVAITNQLRDLSEPLHTRLDWDADAYMLRVVL